MPKDKSKSPEVKFHWGSFCRRGLIDQHTKLLTVVDMLPGLTLHIDLPKDYEEEEFGFGVGMLSAVVVFMRTEPPRGVSLPVPLKFQVFIGEDEVEPQEVNASIPGDQWSSHLIVGIEPPLIPVPVKPGEYTLSARVKVWHKGKEFGEVVMPINARVNKK